MVLMVYVVICITREIQHYVFCVEGLNEVRPAVYRAALKLRSLQKLCQSESNTRNVVLLSLLLYHHTETKH